jgi:hypothetical protein
MTYWIYKNNLDKFYKDEDDFTDENGILYSSFLYKGDINGMRSIPCDPLPDLTLVKIIKQSVQMVDEEINGVTVSIPKVTYTTVNLKPEEIQYFSDKKLREEAFDELLELDKVLPRSVEDVVATYSLDKTMLPTIQQDRIARKEELRQLINDTEYTTRPYIIDLITGNITLQ